MALIRSGRGGSTQPSSLAQINQSANNPVNGVSKIYGVPDDGGASVPPSAPPVNIFSQVNYVVHRKTYLNTNTSTSSWMLSVVVTPAHVRAPLVLNRPRKQNVNETTVVNLLTSTLTPQAGVSGTIAVTTQNDTSAASGTPVVTGTVNKTETPDTMTASGTVGSAATAPFVPPLFETVQRRRINTILYGGRAQNPQEPIIPSDPLLPHIFVVAQRKPNRFTSFDFPNLLTSSFEPQKIASGYPESIKILRKQNVYFEVFPNLAVVLVPGPVTGTVNYTNLNDTLAASGSPIVNGTISRTNADDTMTASGDVGVAVSGTISVTTANDTMAASGSPIASGVIAYTENFDVSAISGSPVQVGTIAKTNNNDVMSASGTSGPIIAGAGTKLPMTGVGV